MAVTVTDNRTALYSDGLTNITGASATETSFVAELASCAAEAYNIATGQIYWSGTTPNFTTDGNELIYIWSAVVATQNGYKEATAADSSHATYLSDGTNDLIIYQAGNDRDVFKHADGQVSFQCMLVDIDYLGTLNTNGDLAATGGSYASFNASSTSMDVGSHYTTLSKALGGGDNCYLDIIRYGGADDGIQIGGGTTGDRGTFAEVAVEDRSQTSGKAHGILREYTGGAYGCQGTLRIGNTSTASSYFEEDGFTLTFEDRPVSDDKYKFVVEANSTGTNVCVLTNAAIASARPAVEVDMSGANINELTITTSVFSNLLNPISLPTDTNGTTLDHNVTFSTFENCGTIDIGTVAFTGNSINNTNGTSAITKALDGSGSTTIEDNSFSTSATDHAITVTGTVETLNITNCNFSGYATSDGSDGDEVLFVNIASGSMTVNVSGGSGTVSVRTAGATVTVVQDPVTTQYTVNDTSGSAISGARVFLETSDGTGPLPFEEAVTITQTGGTATVAHTAHGIPDGTNVVIRGADQNGYNKVAAITVVNANSYTYSVDSGTVSPSTGTEVASGVIIHDTTNGSGIVSDTRTFGSDQPFKGFIRDSSGSPYHQAATVTGTVSSTSGFTATIALLSDE